MSAIAVLIRYPVCMYEVLAIVALTALYVLWRRWLKMRQLRSSENWPVADGYVAQIEEKRDDNGFLVVTLVYTYRVADERYVGRESFPFVRDEDAASFEAGCKERSVRVHYRPEKPNVSALARESGPSCC
jgi:hypothetical protein